MRDGQVGRTWKGLVKSFTVFWAKDDRTAHFSTNTVFAGCLPNDGLARWEYCSSEIARFPIFWPLRHQHGFSFNIGTGSYRAKRSERDHGAGSLVGFLDGDGPARGPFESHALGEAAPDRSPGFRQRRKLSVPRRLFSTVSRAPSRIDRILSATVRSVCRNVQGPRAMVSPMVDAVALDRFLRRMSPWMRNKINEIGSPRDACRISL